MLLLLMLLVLAEQSTQPESPRKPSPIFMAVGTGEYLSDTYLLKRSPHFVFFVGEPLKLKVVVGNPGPEELSFRFDGLTIAEMFNISGTRDGTPVTVRLTFDQGQWKDVSGGVFPFDAREPTHLKALERVEWKAQVDEPLLPGVYRIRVAPNAVDERSGKIMAMVTFYDFEVRPATPNDQPEILRREALRHYIVEDPEELEKSNAAVERLLEVHPTSYEAFLIRGKLARARGDHAAAVMNEARAARILQNDEDSVLLKTKSREEIERLKGNPK